MELILLSLFGIASLFALEFFGLFYGRRLSESHLSGAELHASPSGNQTGAPMATQFLACSEAANDAYTTTVVRGRSPGSGMTNQGYDHV